MELMYSANPIWRTRNGGTMLRRRESLPLRPDSWTPCGSEAHTRIVKMSLTPVDPLGQALHFLRMTGVMYCRSELTAPWALEMPKFDDCLMFHIVTVGRCRLQVDGCEDRVLQPGEFALVPHGAGHRLTSDP